MTKTIVICIGLLMINSSVYSESKTTLFWVQDISIPDHQAETDFKNFGEAILAMPLNSELKFYSSAGQLVYQGMLSPSHKTREMQDRRMLIMRSAEIFKNIRSGNSTPIRDYALVLNLITRSIKSGDLIVFQGNPLYLKQTIDWSGKTPSATWAYHEASPFGLSALPAPSIPFGIMMISNSQWHVSVNHRESIATFYRTLTSRLGGEFLGLINDPVLAIRHIKNLGQHSFSVSQTPDNIQGPLKLTDAIRLH